MEMEFGIKSLGWWSILSLGLDTYHYYTTYICSVSYYTKISYCNLLHNRLTQTHSLSHTHKYTHTHNKTHKTCKFEDQRVQLCKVANVNVQKLYLYIVSILLSLGALC